jgi:ribose transport system permease protein
VGVFGITAIALRQTAWGRRHEAVGKGRAASHLAGIGVRRHLFGAFIVSGVIAGFAGLVLVARLGSAPPNVGEAFTLSAFAAAFLGATMLRPGFFNATGTLVAILLIAVGINGLLLAGVENYIERLFTGAVLLLAVGLSRLERLSAR